MSGMHFERMARDYVGARPPYPGSLYEVLLAQGVIGPHARVLEVGAGTGLATREVVGSGSAVVALEPGAELAELPRLDVPEASIVVARLEDADLPPHAFDSAIAATSLHWVDLSIGLPKLHAALRPGGRLAVWRTIFGDDSIDTAFRDRVAQIVARRQVDGAGAPTPRGGPAMEELASGGWFEPARSRRWTWSIELSADQVHRLFRTFSDWSSAEAELAARAAADLGGRVTEHYQTVLHVLTRADAVPSPGNDVRVGRRW